MIFYQTNFQALEEQFSQEQRPEMFVTTALERNLEQQQVAQQQVGLVKSKALYQIYIHLEQIKIIITKMEQIYLHYLKIENLQTFIQISYKEIFTFYEHYS